MEELDENLRSIQKYNHKLIRKHGHDDLEKLKQKGIFNYADFMDVETNKKLKKWRKQRRREAAQISDKELSSFNFIDKRENQPN